MEHARRPPGVEEHARGKLGVTDFADEGVGPRCLAGVHMRLGSVGLRHCADGVRGVGVQFSNCNGPEMPQSWPSTTTCPADRLLLDDDVPASRGPEPSANAAPQMGGGRCERKLLLPSEVSKAMPSCEWLPAESCHARAVADLES